MPIGVEIDSKLKSPLDLSKESAAGLEIPSVRGAFENAFEAKEQYAKDLEDRYRNPNYFKIAAGFAKPQLGGFLASLGSAAEALGESTEQQRAIQPTISRIRAEVAAGQIPFVRRVEQQKKFDDYMRNFKKTGQHDFNTLGEIKNLDPESSASKSIDSILSSQSSVAGTTSTNVGTQIRGQEAYANNPSLVLNDPIFKGTAVEKSPERLQESLDNLNASRPKDMSIERWNALGTSAKIALVADYTKQVAMQGLDEEKTSEITARSANNLLNDLTYLRTLAVDPKLAPLFSFMKNGDGLSMFRSFLDKNQGNVSAAIEGMVAAAQDQFKNSGDNEEDKKNTREKVDRLVKGIARLEVNLRGSNVNPTDALQQLNTQQSPSLANSQAGFVGILDQMGMQAKHDIDRHNLRIDSNVPAKKIYSNPSFEENYRREVEKLAKRNSLDSTELPSWYTPQNTATQNNVQPSASNRSATSNSSQSRGNTRTVNGVVYDLANGEWVRRR